MISFVRSFVGYALTLLGLTGLVDNVVEWHGFARNIIEHYANVREFFFGWLPDWLPNWFGDYLIVGLGVGASASHMFARTPALEDRNLDNFVAVVLLGIGFGVIWPISLCGAALVSIYKDDSDGSDVVELRNDLKHFWKRFGLTLLVFLGFLFVASDLFGRF